MNESVIETRIREVRAKLEALPQPDANASPFETSGARWDREVWRHILYIAECNAAMEHPKPDQMSFLTNFVLRFGLLPQMGTRFECGVCGHVLQHQAMMMDYSTIKRHREGCLLEQLEEYKEVDAQAVIAAAVDLVGRYLEEFPAHFIDMMGYHVTRDLNVGADGSTDDVDLDGDVAGGSDA